MLNLLRRLFPRPSPSGAADRSATRGRVGVDVTMITREPFTGGDPWRGAVLGLPVLESFTDIADLLGIEPGTLVWLTFQPRTPGTSHYFHFTIPKRAGGVRLISTPKPVLAAAQRRIMTEILAKVPPHDAATAFRPGASIVQHAGRHVRQGVVIRLDLEDFFPSITRRRVKGLFASLGFNPGVSTVLSRLVTERPVEVGAAASGSPVTWAGPGSLPQGACTSPAISNLICRRLDARLAGLAARHGFTYSRYADDLTFSHPNAAIALGRQLSSAAVIVRDEGFRLHEAKTRVMRAHQRQIVTGLTVNDGVAIPRADLRRFRAMLHACERFGLDAVSHDLGMDALSHVRGYTSYIAMVDPPRAARFQEQHPWLGAGNPP